MNKINLNLKQNKKIKETHVKKLLDERKLIEMFESMNNDNNDTINNIFLKYPHVNDPNFQKKITLNKEFFFPYDGKIKDIKKEADEVCFKPFTLSNHQKLIKNFMSHNTPYNGLLLYHGLGSGKTCSAIGVTENMRKYMEISGKINRMIIVASPNVQENFRLQLFDHTKLIKTNAGWEFKTIRCEGQNFLDDLKHINTRQMSKEELVKKVHRMIDKNYLFMGYIEFANYIEKVIKNVSSVLQQDKEEYIKKKINKLFKNRLIVIDEIHNIRKTEDTKDDKQDYRKKIASNLLTLVNYVDNMKLLFLSATPMYNDPKEIIFLLNILNLNDNRALIKVSDVFDKKGNLKKDKGTELLIMKSRGYISYVRGENPYSFPFGIFPKDFSPENSLLNMKYPVNMFNKKLITEPIEYSDLFIDILRDNQEESYLTLIEELKSELDEEKMKKFEESDSFSYYLTMKLIECLNIAYPIKEIDNVITVFTGKRGLKEFLSFKSSLTPPLKNNYKYKDLERYGRIFSPELLPNYSIKISSITNEIMKSTGIVLIYSQYIDSGIIPVCLALEELGFKRYGEKNKSLFYQDKKDSNYEIDELDVNTMKRYSELNNNVNKKQASYIVISGDPSLSPDNKGELNAATNEKNNYGNDVKVILISQAGSEGLDFSNIRQVHILEPWYNRNRLEQVIGRAIRNCSHKNLPLEERNVCIYQHATLLSSNSEEETADLLNYRLSELKDKKISKIKRILKENSIDCNLNYLQTNFANMNQKLKIKLSNNININYSVGDKPFTSFCDYDKTCYYTCINPLDITKIENKDLTNNSIQLNYYSTNFNTIFEIIKKLFKQHSVYKIDEFIVRLLADVENNNNVNKLIKVNDLTKEQIIFVLNEITTNQNYIVHDKYNRSGHITNIDYLLLFTPFELSGKLESSYSYFHKLTKKDRMFTKNNLVIENINNNNNNRNNDSGLNLKKQKIDKLNEIYIKMNRKYEKMIEEHKVLRGEQDPDKHFYYVYNQFITNNSIDNEIIKQILSNMIIEYLTQDEIFELGKYILSKKWSNEVRDYEKEYELYLNITNYFDGLLIESSSAENTRKKAIYFYMNNEVELYILDLEMSELRKARIEDRRDFSNSLNKYKIDGRKKLNNIIGYIETFKKDNSKIFKIRKLDTKNPGARSDQKSKPDNIELLNNILGRNVYNKENTKKITKIQLCFLQEMYLRYYNYINKNDKIWFLTENQESLFF